MKDLVLHLAPYLPRVAVAAVLSVSSWPAVAQPPAAVVQEPRWKLALGVRGHWSDNVDFATAAEPAVATTGSAAIAFTPRTSRGAFSTNATAAYLYYPEFDRLTRFTYGAGLSSSYPLSPNFTVSLGGRAFRAYARDIEFLTAAGNLLPVVETTVSEVRSGFVARLSPKTSLGVDGQYEYVDFSNVDQLGQPTTGLIDGDTFRAGARLLRQLRPNHGLSFSYGYQTTQARGREGTANSFYTSWTAKLSGRVTANLSFGASHFEYSGAQVALGWTPYAVASIEAKRERGSFELRLARSIEPAYGFGRDRIFNVGTLDYDRPVSRRVHVGVGVSYGRGSDPADSSFKLDTQSAHAQLTFNATRRIGFSTGYHFRRAEIAQGSSFVEHMVTLSTSWTREWH